MEDQETLREFCTLTLKQRMVEDQFAQSRALQRAHHIAAGEALLSRLDGYGDKGVVVHDPVSGKRVMVRRKIRPVTRALKDETLCEVARQVQWDDVEATARDTTMGPAVKPFQGCVQASDPGVATLAAALFDACSAHCFTTSSTLEVADPLRRFQGEVIEDDADDWMPHVERLRSARHAMATLRSSKPLTYKNRLAKIGEKCIKAYGRLGGCMALQVNLGGKPHTFFMQQRRRFAGVKPMTKRMLYDSITTLVQQGWSKAKGRAVQHVLDNLKEELKQRRYAEAKEETYLTVVRKGDRASVRLDNDDDHNIMTDDDE